MRYYSRAATKSGRRGLLFEGGDYSRAVSDRGNMVLPLTQAGLKDFSQVLSMHSAKLA